MKHIVYLIKINREKFPNKYIGSKANCSVVDGKIVDQRGKQYKGSATDKEYRSLMEYCDDYSVQILGEFDTYKKALEAEKLAHIANDVVASPEFFNKSIATISNYSNPDYATFKHSVTGKVCRLPRNHPKVLSKEWVGVTKGRSLTEDEKKRRGRSGEQNGFFGKKHTEETKRNSGKKIGDKHRGKQKTDEQRRKMAEARRLWWVARKADNSSREKESV